MCKNQAFDNDRKAMKLILLGFLIKWEIQGKTYSIYQETKETILDFSQGNVKVL